MRRAPFIAALMTTLVLARPASAQPEPRDAYNPGWLGPNALPPQPLEAAWIPASVQVALGLATQWAAPVPGAGGVSLTMPFRVEVPFAGRASLVVEGQPFEWWSVSAATHERWGLTATQGLTKGDLRFGGKFLLFDGGRRFPSLTFRALTKTTTGKGLGDRRFTNAPGYLLDAVASHRFEWARGFCLELHAALGFFAWQQGAFGQNDALSGALGVRAGWHVVALQLELRGHRGWQAFARPTQLAATFEARASTRLAVGLVATAGLNDPRALELKLVLRFGRAVLPPERDDVHRLSATPTQERQ